MSYYIQYSPEKNGKYPANQPKRSIRWSRWIIAICLLAGGLWVKVRGVPDLFIPGNPEITRLAASNLMKNVRSGERIEDAFTVFCKQILDGAKE